MTILRLSFQLANPKAVPARFGSALHEALRSVIDVLVERGLLHRFCASVPRTFAPKGAVGGPVFSPFLVSTEPTVRHLAERSRTPPIDPCPDQLLALVRTKADG